MIQTIISIFIAFVIIEEWNLEFRIGLINKKLAKFKLFKCLPCFTFWTALIVGLFLNNSIEMYIVNSMLAYIVAIFLDNRKK